MFEKIPVHSESHMKPIYTNEKLLTVEAGGIYSYQRILNGSFGLF
jgi:hypothetical protein